MKLNVRLGFSNIERRDKDKTFFACRELAQEVFPDLAKVNTGDEFSFDVSLRQRKGFTPVQFQRVNYFGFKRWKFVHP